MVFSQWFAFLHPGRQRSAAARSRCRVASRSAPSCTWNVEQLEDRTLLAVSLTGVPNWVEQGPGPLLNGQVEGMTDNPVAGAIRTIAPHPTQANTVLIGSVNGGIWRTTNANAASPNWTPLIDDFPGLSIASITFSPRDDTGNTIYAGVGAVSSFGNRSGPLTGLLKSTDGGSTWQLVGSQLRGLDIRAVLPAAGTGEEVVLAATNGGLFRSTNGGLTFTPVVLGNYTDLARDTGVSSRLYAARIGNADRTAAILRSDDRGLTWTRVEVAAMAIADSVNIKLAISPQTGFDPVYAGIVRPIVQPDNDNDPTNNPILNQLTGLFRSGNIGDTWTSAPLPGTTEPPLIGTFVGIHPGGQGGIHFSLAADPNDPDVVYVGGDRQGGIPSSVGNLNFTGRLFRGDFTPAVLFPEICIPFIGCTPAVLAPFWESITHFGAAGTAPHADSRAMAFDSAGNLLQGDDGGIYKLIHPEGSLNPFDLRRWVSLNGNLRITELLALAYDSRNNVILAGAQDNGSVEMIGGIGSPDTRWRLGPLFTIFNQTVVSAVGDGNIQAADIFSANPNVIRYSLGNSFSNFTRRTFNPSGDLITVPQFVRLASSAAAAPLSGLVQADQNAPGFQAGIRFVLNAVDPTRMLIGLNGLYESTNRGDTLTVLDPVPAGSPPVSALAYGGFAPGPAIPGVVYVARGPGLRMRAALGGAFVAAPALPAGSGNIVDIVLNPANFRTAYVVTSANRVFRLDNVGLAGASVTRIDNNLGNLGATALTTIEIFRSATGQRVVLVGGRDGVYRTLDSDTLGAGASWHEFGAGLPNARVTDIRHDPTDDLLLVSTLGRGAWTMPGASAALVTPATLTITGDTNFVPLSDAITLVRNDARPWMLDVFLNAPTTGTPSFSVRLSTLQDIVINGLGGNDTLTVDSVNGPIAVPGGIRFDGGGNLPFIAFTDTLVLRGGSATSDLYQPLPGNAARSTIGFSTDDDFNGTNQSVAQTVNTIRVEAVRDLVDVNGALTLDYTALNLTDTLTLQDDLDSTLRVTSTRTAPVQFGRKLSLFLNAGDQNDQINLVNTVSAFGLNSLTVNARGGTDTINVERTVVTTVIDAGAGADIINVGREFGTFLSLVTLVGITAPLTVRGGPGADTLNVKRTELELNSLPGQMDRTAPGSAQMRITGLGMSDQILYEDVTNVNVRLGAVGDFFTVAATAAGVITTVETGGGADVVNVGNGTVNDIRGALNIDQVNPVNGGADLVVLNDSTDPTPSIGTVDRPAGAALGTGVLTGFGMGAAVNLTGTEAVRINTGPADDNVILTAAFLAAPAFAVNQFLDGGGNDGVTFHGTDGDDYIRVSRRDGPNGAEVIIEINGQTIVGDYLGGETVRVLAGRGDDTVIFDESAAATWRAELFGEAGNDHLVGSLRNDLLDGGKGHDVLDGGGGDDTLQGGVGADTLYGGMDNDSLQGDEGNDSLNGGTGTNTLVESGNVNFTLTNTSLTGMGTDRLGNLQFANLTGGSSDNVFTVSGWTGNGSITGSSGTDQIVAVRDTDMTLTNTSLVMAGFGTLALNAIEKATLTGGDSANVLCADAFTLGAVTLQGGNGDDVLIGGSKNDSLFGGAGRDVLIGGLGADTIGGGTGDDLLIGGTSSLSSNIAALNAIMAEWTSTNSYAARVANLRNGGGANGTTKLDTTTVQNDSSAADCLIGGSEMDWFFQSVSDVLVDFNAGIGEIKTAI